MDLGTVVLIWLTSVCACTLICHASDRSVWWVGTVSAALFGPFGLTLVALDIATYKPGTKRLADAEPSR